MPTMPTIWVPVWVWVLLEVEVEVLLEVEVEVEVEVLLEGEITPESLKETIDVYVDSNDAFTILSPEFTFFGK